MKIDRFQDKKKKEQIKEKKKAYKDYLPLKIKDAEEIERRLNKELFSSKGSAILTLGDLLAIIKVSEEVLVRTFNKMMLRAINNKIIENRIKVKAKVLKILMKNTDAASMKILLQLVSSEDEYKRISNSWTYTDIEEDMDFVIPHRSNKEK